MPRKHIQVVPPDSGWAVEAEVGAGDRQLYATQDEAIPPGTRRAKQEYVDLLIHGCDGQIMRNSFGSDPRDVKR